MLHCINDSSARKGEVLLTYYGEVYGHLMEYETVPQRHPSRLNDLHSRRGPFLRLIGNMNANL